MLLHLSHPSKKDLEVRNLVNSVNCFEVNENSLAAVVEWNELKREQKDQFKPKVNIFETNGNARFCISMVGKHPYDKYASKDKLPHVKV